MILVVDHYDSFTYNLVQLVESLGHPTEVVKSDAEPAEALAAREPEGVILSPGPGRPEDAGCFTELLDLLPSRTPVLGVCLGHQAMVEAFGGRVVTGDPVHGKDAEVEHDGKSIFEGLPSPVVAGRYHSLVADPALPDELEVTSSYGDVVMGVRHRELPAEGVQFHPESVLTPHGPYMLANFLRGGVLRE